MAGRSCCCLPVIYLVSSRRGIYSRTGRAPTRSARPDSGPLTLSFDGRVVAFAIAQDRGKLGNVQDVCDSVGTYRAPETCGRHRCTRFPAVRERHPGRFLPTACGVRSGGYALRGQKRCWSCQAAGPAKNGRSAQAPNPLRVYRLIFLPLPPPVSQPDRCERLLMSQPVGGRHYSYLDHQAAHPVQSV
jgi:hypothetical protein